MIIVNYLKHDKLKIISMSGGGADAAPSGGPLKTMFQHYFLFLAATAAQEAHQPTCPFVCSS